MTARPTSMRRSLDEYVDQVKRKEEFLAAHPDVRISLDADASPYGRWRGQVPDCPETTSHDLGRLLDHLEDLVAARDARTRWPNWTFARKLSGWQAEQVDGPELVVGRTFEQAEARVAQVEGSALRVEHDG